eukprot:11198769-Lingulodinium_polyedra.AAC.1
MHIGAGSHYPSRLGNLSDQACINHDAVIKTAWADLVGRDTNPLEWRRGATSVILQAESLDGPPAQDPRKPPRARRKG